MMAHQEVGRLGLTRVPGDGFRFFFGGDWGF